MARVGGWMVDGGRPTTTRWIRHELVRPAHETTWREAAACGAGRRARGRSRAIRRFRRDAAREAREQPKQKMVPEVGFEPTRDYSQGILSRKTCVFVTHYSRALTPLCS